MPNTAIPNIDINKAAADINKAIKDGAYIAIGLGVLGFQRAQVQRVELTKQLESQLEHLTTLPGSLNGQAEGYAQTARSQAEHTRAQVAEQLGELSKTARAQLTELAKSVDEQVQPVRRQLDEQVDKLEQILPAGARSVVQSVRAAAATPEQLLRTAVGLD